MHIRTCGVAILGKVYDQVKPEELETFHLWAFGIPNILIVDFVKLWNKKHGAVLFINEDAIEVNCARLIIKLWEER